MQQIWFTSLACSLALGCVAAVASAEEGGQFAFSYTGEFWSVADGGLSTGSRYLHQWDLLADWHPFGAPDSQLHLHVLGTNGAGLTDELVGDLQAVSNIDAPEAVRILEAWYEKRFGSEHSLRVGLYDLNSEFDASETAALFVNSSHGVGPDLSQSGANGPSIFPVTGLALRWTLPITEWLQMRVALLDAAPGDAEDPRSHSLRLSAQEGALAIVELDLQGDGGARGYVGAWSYTQEAPTLLGETSERDRARAFGGYVGAQTPLSNDLRAFVRVGFASSAVHIIDRYVGGGLTWSPPWQQPISFGLALAHASTGSEYRRLTAQGGARAESAETALELTARLELPGGFALQPDVQYVVNPGADSVLDDAVLFGLRFEWSIER